VSSNTTVTDRLSDTVVSTVSAKLLPAGLTIPLLMRSYTDHEPTKSEAVASLGGGPPHVTPSRG